MITGLDRSSRILGVIPNCETIVKASISTIKIWLKENGLS